MVTDLDFTDDIALVSDTASKAQEILDRVETTAIRVGLHMNSKKTKCIIFNQQEDVSIRTTSGTILEVVQDFKYLGSWMHSTSRHQHQESASMESLQQAQQNMEIYSS